MKIRKGFVSNSSSSSFLVVWDKKPGSVEEVHQILFDGLDTHSYWDDHFDAKKLSEIIFNDTQEATEKQILEEIRSSYYFEDWNNKNVWRYVGYKADKKLLEEYAKNKIELNRQIDFYESMYKEYSEKDKEFIQRKVKLERVNQVETELTKREKDLLEIKAELEKYKKLSWDRNDTNKLVKDSYNKMMEDFKDKFFAVYSYSDNDGSINSCLEHSEVFDNIQNWRNSHH